MDEQERAFFMSLRLDGLREAVGDDSATIVELKEMDDGAMIGILDCKAGPVRFVWTAGNDPTFSEIQATANERL